MINTQKLKGRMAEKNKTFRSLAPKVSCSAYTLGQKVSNKAPITLQEVNILADELDITDKEFKDFFLQR